MKAERIIHNASQLLTLAGPPQRGETLGELHIVEDGALLIQGERIAEVGKSDELLAAHPQAERVDAGGRVVMPGLVDPHTHAVWAGDRAAEFEMRLQGKTYLEIMQAGGGIVSTVRQTRAATLDQLVAETRPRLQRMFAYGTTTAEVKSGYGLETAAEIKMLEAILQLDAEGPLDLAATFLGAHAIPEEFKDDPQGYTDLICEEMLPAVRNWWRQSPEQPVPALPFTDVFCETGAFTQAQSRQIL